VSLAQHAAVAGAVGVSSVLPPLLKDLDCIEMHYAAIAASVPNLLFFPYLFGGQVDAVTLMRRLRDKIPNVAGAKYTGPNMFELWQLNELDGDDWTIFSGMDEQCLFAAMSGSSANIGSTLNVMPGAYRQMRADYEAGNVTAARDLQIRANRLTRALIASGFSGTLREAMRLLGFDCGEPRLPNTALPDEKRAVVQERLLAAGLRELAAI
jgi:N-acetylneuraminate lyase